MSDSVNVFSNITNLDVSPQFESYSKVIIHVNDETTYEYGNDGGRTLEIDNPFGTPEMAQSILESLQRTDSSTETAYRYQPYDAQGTIINPAAEIGDALSATNVYGGIYTRSRNFGRLMKANVSAPHDEEINHEYQYESPQEREFKRETGKLSARLSITEADISTEVIRATSAESSLSSRITQNAEAISATVSATGGDNSTFGWTLNATSWTLKSNGQDVFKADASGVEVNGKITATSGQIGGFNIAQNAIYNGTTSLSSWIQGVYLGTNGIRIVGTNHNNFTADSNGNISAENMTLTGTLIIGGTSITAAALRSGAQSAYTNSGTWSTGAGYGYSYNQATQSGTTSYPTYFTCGTLYCNRIVCDTYTTSMGNMSARSIGTASRVLGN